MSFIVDILIKKDELEKVNIKESYIEWGEEKLSHDPPKYTYNSSLTFHKNTDMNYYVDFVKNDVDVHEFAALTLEGDKLEELDKLVNSKKEINYSNDLISFINDLYISLEEFYFIKLRNEECIDESYIINDANKAVNKLIESLNRNSPKGIMIIKKRI